MQPLPSIRCDDGRPSRGRTGRSASTAAVVRMDVHHGLPRPMVRVRGELDISTVPLLIAMLDHARRRHPLARGGPQQRGAADALVDVDLSQVTFADSHGLAPVLNGSATVVRASDSVRRVLDLVQEGQPRRRAKRTWRSTGAPAARCSGVDVGAAGAQGRDDG